MPVIWEPNNLLSIKSSEIEKKKNVSHTKLLLLGYNNSQNI